MNELSPVMCRSDPAGSGGAGCVGGGRRNVVRARTTALEGPASPWPIVALTAAAPTATEPVIRNARRPGRDAGPAGRGGGAAAAGGGGAESARSVADAARTSRDMVYAPAAAPSRTGRTSIALESG